MILLPYKIGLLAEAREESAPQAQKSTCWLLVWLPGSRLGGPKAYQWLVSSGTK